MVIIRRVSAVKPEDSNAAIERGQFRQDLDPVQILFAFSGLGFHYLDTRHTGTVVYGSNLMSPDAKAARLAFNIDAVLRIVCKPETLLKLEKFQ